MRVVLSITHNTMRQRKQIETEAVMAMDRGNSTEPLVIELLLDIRELLAQPTLHHDFGRLRDQVEESDVIHAMGGGFASLHVSKDETLTKLPVSDASEFIICAAVRAKDGHIHRGHRHNDALRAMQGMPAYKDERPYGDDQGFITSTGRYVNRKEAMQIQIAAGKKSQDPEHGPAYHGDELYSEDLY